MMKRLAVSSGFGSLVWFIGGFISPARAASSFDPTQTTNLSDPLKAYGELGNLFSILFTILLIAGAITAVGFFIFGAIQYGTAGSGDGAAKARRTMTAAVVGLILMGLVYVFIHFYNTILPSSPPS